MAEISMWTVNLEVGQPALKEGTTELVVLEDGTVKLTISNPWFSGLKSHHPQIKKTIIEFSDKEFKDMLSSYLAM